MNEEKLGFEIQAAILPELKGAAELEQSIESFGNKIQNRISQLTSQSNFTEGLSGQDKGKVEHFASGVDVLEFQKFKEQAAEILEELDIDASTGSLNLQQRKKYLRKFSKQKYKVEELQQDLLDELDDPYFDFLGAEKKDILRTTIVEGAREAQDEIDELKNRFMDFADSLNHSKEEARGLFDQLKQLSLPALGGMVVNETMRYIRGEAEIGAKDLTSFNLTNPISMYSERRMFEAFSETKSREMNYHLIGTLLGGALGAIGGPLGALAGAGFGGMVGSGVADIFNIQTQAEAEEELKKLQQTYGTLSGYVNATGNYDVLRARTRARLGQGAIGSLNLGYAPEQELQFREAFANSAGFFTEDLYRDQTTFARALGLNPGEIYGLNLSARVTGMDTSIDGLARGQNFTNRIFGDDVSPSRIIEVLQEIKKINEDMLKINIEADPTKAMQFAAVPESLFGISNPYGRISDLGGTTLKLLEGLMQPRTQAHEAFLFSMFGGEGLVNFSEIMKGGIYDDVNNIGKILGGVNQWTGGNQMLNYFALSEMMPNAPKGFIPQLTNMIDGNGVEITRRAINGFDKNSGNFIYGENETVTMTLQRMREEQNSMINLLKEAGLTEGDRSKLLERYQTEQMGYSGNDELLNKYTQQANKAISETERMIEEVKNIQIEAAKGWRSTIRQIEVETAEFWNKMSKVPEMQQFIYERVLTGLDAMDAWRAGKGYLTDDEKELIENRNFKEKQRQRQSWIDNKLPIPEHLRDNPQPINTYSENLEPTIRQLSETLQKGITVYLQHPDGTREIANTIQ